ncbi:EAL domain-containing protein, partial [Rhizobium ruizarguesonis]
TRAEIVDCDADAERLQCAQPRQALFGTGYSSLSYLRSFPFDKIKLDRSFVSGIETDAGNLAIVRAVVGIGSGFNATTLAEGIETEE